MSRSWYQFLIQKNPSNYKNYQRINKSWFVIDFSSEFEVLSLHRKLFEFSIKKNFHYDLEKAQIQITNAGYIHLQNNAFDESSWIPLLPDYTVYTSLEGKFFKFFIKREENSLYFVWQEFRKDFTFTSCNAEGQEKLGFHLMIKHYNLKNTSLTSILGLNESTIIEILQRTVHKELEKIYDNEENSIFCRISLEVNGKNITPESTQALMLKDKVIQLQNERSNLDNKTDLNQKSEKIKKAVYDILDEKNLGSTILISIEQYLSLVLFHPCSHCYNTNFHSKSCHVSYTGINFSHLVVAAALANAVIGITTQSCRWSYHQYQSQMFPTIISRAVDSAKQALNAAISYANTKQKKSLIVGFDCSWSHSRNAGQASGEFIYLDDLEAVVAFYVVEKSHIITKKGKVGASADEKIIVQKGNFDTSSHQMKHAILIALLEKITPILEESDLLLEVCVDGDLDSNKTLANVPVFEQYIMRYFNGCVFAAGLKKKNNKLDVPTNEELRYIQVEGLIQHLLNNHNLCWKEVCWHKENEELQLQSPTLQSFTKTEIKGFRQMLLTIFKLPIQQSLVTQYRTTYNEAFNQKILRFLDKRIDFWASYKARYALIIIDNNEGLNCMMRTVREAAQSHDFSLYDQSNIIKFTGERQSQLDCNRNNIAKRNQERACNDDDLKSNIYNRTGWWECLLNKNYIPSGEKHILDSKELIILVAKQIFGYNQLREEQLEAIETYLDSKDTLVSIKIGGGNPFRELVCLGILCTSIYANSIQGKSEQAKIFEEIALGFTKFIIDEAHCILDYSNFRESWKNLGLLKKNWPMVPIMLLTATCIYQDVQDIRISLKISVENFAIIRDSYRNFQKKDNCEIFLNELINLIKKYENGRAIIYCAIQSGCDNLFAILQPLLPDKNLAVYHGGLGDEQRESIMSHWKDHKIKIMIGTNAFGMGINSSDVYL
ncbi:8077_t:CDS:10, partial [Funneliformis caledonium]